MLKEFNLLYVEDEEELLEITAKTFKMLFKNVYTQQNGKEALAFFEKNKNDIDLIVTDINMPHMNGIDMSKEIRNLDPNIPIVITSANNDNSFLVESINIGINGYLLKPVLPKQLKATLQKVLEPLILKQQLIQQEEEAQKKLLLQTKFAAIGQLSAGLTHEINTPLTYIKGSNDILGYTIEDLPDSKTKEEIIEHHSIINDGVHRLINLVESMKEMANQSTNIQENANIFETILVACTMVYNRSKHVVNISINDEQFDFNMDKNKQTFTAFVQKQRIEQVWIIIINNAMDELIKIEDFENRKFSISLEENDDSVIVKFIDNAGGIHQDILERIFEPLKSTKESSGMGMGLSLAKKIIDDQNAHIEAYNENNGAVFKITLPKKNN